MHDDKVVQSGGMSHQNSVKMNEVALAPDLLVKSDVQGEVFAKSP